MRESTLRQKLIKALSPLDAISVENAARAGTPDINYIEGWIEIKWVLKWPQKTVTPLKVNTFTPQQRVWIMRRAQAGGTVHVMLRVGKEWILLPGLWAALNLGKTAVRSEIVKNAQGHWISRLDCAELVEILRVGRAVGAPKN